MGSIEQARVPNAAECGQLQSTTNTLEEREEQLAREWQKLEKEKQRMAAFTKCSSDDLVEINIGGKVMMTDRATLLLAQGTLLAQIFSGRSEPSLRRDGAGRVFLDFSPRPFKALLSFLRALRKARPGAHVAPPMVPPDCQKEYQAMVRYLDLEEFLNTRSRQCPTDALAYCPADALVCAQSAGGTYDGSVRCNGGVLHKGAWGHSGVVGGARLLGGDGSRSKAAWKVTIRALTNAGCLCAGVICNASPADDSHCDPTCWAWWADRNYTVSAGHLTKNDGWTGWAQGDVAVFQLDVFSGLRMFHRRSGQVHHTMQGVPADVTKQARVHFIFWLPGTEVEVSQVSAEDLAEAGF